MFAAHWWERIFGKLLSAPVRRQKSRTSTRRMELEKLEDRLVPAFAATSNIHIFVTGGVTSISFTDPNRFNDGAVSPLHEIGNSHNFVAANLRSAVTDAKAFGGHNTILLETNTYDLTQGELLVQFSPQTALTIRNMQGGGNYSTITRATRSPFRLFENQSGGTTTMNNLILSNGLDRAGASGEPGQGGAVLNEGNLILTNDQFMNNNAIGYGGGSGATPGQGGALANGPTLLFQSGNAQLTINDCLFENNSATGGSGANAYGSGAAGQGGAIYLNSNSGRVSITGSTFSSNQASGGDASDSSGTGGIGGGGAIELAQTGIRLDIVNSTFANNSVSGGSGYGGGNGYGGAILTQNQNQVNLVNDTIANNNSFGNEGTSTNGTGYGGGVANFGGISINPPSFVNVVNTIIANNMADGANNDLFGTFNSLGHNLIGAATGTGFNQPGDQTGTSGNPLDPGLDPNGLQNNGGPTPTIALQVTSPAINKGDNGVVTPHSALLQTLGIAPLKTDQRGTGFPRKVDYVVDIGAFEFQMNLDKVYRLRSNAKSPATLNVPAPGLLLGSEPFVPGEAFFSVQLVGPPPGGGTSLNLNSNGSFTFTVPPGTHGVFHFDFRVLLDGEVPTNLIYTATINVGGGGLGRDLIYTVLGLGLSVDPPNNPPKP